VRPGRDADPSPPF